MGRGSIGIVAIAALCLAAPAAAQQQPQPAQADQAQPQDAAADASEIPPEELELKLAERSDVQQTAAVAKRPRAARVTTCRCGDLASQQ